MLCWAGMSFYECTAEFRFFWSNSKLAESGALEAPSHYHKYRFSAVPVYNCDEGGLQAAYTGTVPYVKDGLIFYNKCVLKLSVFPSFHLLFLVRICLRCTNLCVTKFIKWETLQITVICIACLSSHMSII